MRLRRFQVLAGKLEVERTICTCRKLLLDDSGHLGSELPVERPFLEVVFYFLYILKYG